MVLCVTVWNTTVDMPKAQATTIMVMTLVPRCSSTKAQSASTPSVIKAAMATTAINTSVHRRLRDCDHHAGLVAGSYKSCAMTYPLIRRRNKIAKNRPLPTTPITVPTGIS